MTPMITDRFNPQSAVRNPQSSVARRCALGRLLGPADRAAAIRCLEMEALGFAAGAQMARREEAALNRQLCMKRGEIDRAREADAELRRQGL